MNTNYFSFRRAFDLALQGVKVRAMQWSKEYYFTFAEGELWFFNGKTRRIIPIRELAIWRQIHCYNKGWELMK